MKTPPEKHLNMDNARTREQKELMEKIARDGVCPFCAEHFVKYHPKPIIKETPYWYFTENMSPYEGTKYHFILVYKTKHTNDLGDVESEAVQDLWTLVKWAVQKYNIVGGAFAMRFGDTHFNGSSVTHLHAHIIMGDVDAPGHQAVRMKLG